MLRIHFVLRAALIALIAALGLISAPKRSFSAHEKAFYADATVTEFVRPGLVLKVTGAQIANDGTVTATISVTDPLGLGLDRNGITTPGAVSLSFVLSTIPKGKTQYTAITTRTQKSPITNVSAIQGSADTGGTFTQTGDGLYTYKFGTRATGFDATATHTIGLYGSRNLTSFGFPTNFASTTYNFVPNGSAVTVTRDVVRSTACNNCHDQISAHGGSRRGVEMCILCHNPQSIDPDTGNTIDLAVMVHKLHAGSTLPSVQAGKPYQIIGFNQGVSDWSTVVYPADVRRCETCHDQKSGAAQATAYMMNPNRVACGSCHDDVDFATGKGHPGGPQFDDNLCKNCHIPQGEIDFDASIKGAHTIPTDSQMLSGINVAITKVQNGAAGSKPVVSFTLLDNSKNPIPVSKLGALSFTMAGPTTDYGKTSFGSDVTTPGYVTESALTAANCDNSGNCLYTFTHAVPAGSTGTYAIGVESRRTEVLLAGTTSEQSVQYGAKNQVVYFSVDGSPVAARRGVVATANCNGCHVSLSLHGTLRNQTEYCVICHNSNNTDIARRPTATVAADRTLPPQGINFNLLVHRIHTGENLPPDRPYVVVGFGGSHNDFSDVRYPAMGPTGSTGNTQACHMCHANNSEQTLTAVVNAVTDPQGPINPIQPVGSACTGCHVTIPTAVHVLTNTNSLGEACNVCHSSTAQFSVGSVHAQY